MASYNTNLKNWGATGVEHPDGYNYLEGEQPVDEWDNWLTDQLIGDVKDHLVPLTNSRVETDYGASGGEPGTPETSHLYHDQSNERLELWDSSLSQWRDIMFRDGDTMSGTLKMGTNPIEEFTDLTDDDNNTVWDYSNGHIPQDKLENDAITASAGDGLTGGGPTALGSTFTLNVNPADFAGSSLTEDGSDNLTLVNDSITVAAGTGLTTGGSVSLGGSVTLDHADTSNQSDVSASAGAAITDVSLDGRGHVTSLSTADFDSRYDNYGSFTFEEGDGESTTVGSGERVVVDGGGYLNTELTSSSPPTIKINHDDTSSQTDVSASAGAAITDVSLDGAGHVTSMSSTDFDGRYDNYGSWAIKEADGENKNVGSGQTLQIYGGNSIGTEITSGGSQVELRVKHTDTSSQSDISTGGATVIDDIGLDGRGHVNNMNTENRSLDDWGSANSNVSFGNNALRDVGQVSFANKEHNDLYDPALGWDNSEGGPSFTGGLIFDDDNGTAGWVVHTKAGVYEIQKDGQDGNNVINFKTQ